MDVVGKGVAQGGTYCSNAVGVAAADATLELLEDGQILKAIDVQGRKLAQGISEILTRAGIAHHIQGPGAMFGIVLMEDEPVEFRDLAQHDEKLYETICMGLVARGVIPDPDAREPWFLCAAHDDTAIDETLNIFEETTKSVKG
jgi:glutamate-1-semialdehyde 2,1-aminomutase